jgi:outer membrane protein assembly factor BamE
MTRNQVEFVMGKPVLGDPFNDDQWVYIYTLEVPDYFNQVFKMVLAFEDDTLATISGDYIPQEADAESDAAADEGANETSDETEAESAG